MTGTSACAASSSRVASGPVRSPIAATWRHSTSAVSRIDSPRLSWSSPGRRTSGWPPSSAMPASNETRVRVDGLLEEQRDERPASDARGERVGLELERTVEQARELVGASSSCR